MTVVILSPWINVYQTGVHTPITIYYEQSETKINLVNPKIITLIFVDIVFSLNLYQISSDVSCVVDDFISNLHILLCYVHVLLCYETHNQSIYRWCMKSPLKSIQM